jgi:nicotinamidase-related amidase
MTLLANAKPNQAQLSQASLSQLVIVDIQTKLTAVMPQAAMQSVIKNCGILLQAAQLLNVPVLLTEQYPRGLGPTIPELLAQQTNTKPIEKTHFSCMGEPAFVQQLTRDHSQVILAGMETHICVCQTALDLLANQKVVFVIEDAVISRNPENKANAIARMRDAGCVISNTESLVFEWLAKAEGDAFKTISRLIR